MTRLTTFWKKWKNCVTGWKNILIRQKKIIGNRLKTETKKRTIYQGGKHF